MFLNFHTDCSMSEEIFNEPMVGLQQLILGGALTSRKRYPLAVTAYK